MGDVLSAAQVQEIGRQADDPLTALGPPGRYSVSRLARSHEQLREALSDSLEKRDCLRFELECLDRMRVRDNAYLIEQREAAVRAGGEAAGITITADELDGGYVAEWLDAPGCMSQGETVSEAVRNLADAIAARVALAVLEPDEEKT